MRRSLFLLFILHGFTPFAQNLKDTLRLPEFEIRSNFTIDKFGFKRTRLDSGLILTRQGASLGDVLSSQSTIFIKSYGNGALATPSFRGTSAQHTEVEWNGISLNSPMLGQTDFSKVPINQFTGIEVLYGVAGIARTTGAFGGVINLVTAPDWNNRIRARVSQSVGSFQQYSTVGALETGTQSFQSYTLANVVNAVNDFPYTNNYGDRVRQRNASFSASSISQELFWKVKDRHLFTARAWYMQDICNLPPTTETVDTLKVEKIKDKALRAMIEYKFIQKSWNISARSAMNDTYMKYDNSVLDQHSEHRCHSWINQVRMAYSGISGLSIKPGIDFIRDWVESDDYLSAKSRSTVGLFAEVSYRFLKRVRSTLILRQDMIDEKMSPFIPALGIEYHPFRKIDLAINANAGKNYRYPTLNELWWKYYGNPALSPERNYMFEMGSTYRYPSVNRILDLETTVSAYYSRIFDMITWTPVSGSGGIFRPQNVDEIFARGIETGINVKLKLWGFRFGFIGNYHYCRSTYEKDASAFQTKVGNQQSYIPENTFNCMLNIQKWGGYLVYGFIYTGDRYTGTDNLSVMPAYNLSNIIAGKDINVKHFIITLQVDIENLFDLDYQAIASRPMPGRSFRFTVSLGFPENKKSDNNLRN
ncbi:MAG TPA: TonB-dependent receptor plug domain-containing protein [Bacteroidales bacterium]|nr:TonB-dependent receptor plug domain-containing protein [Bacteroidales bacterium]